MTSPSTHSSVARLTLLFAAAALVCACGDGGVSPGVDSSVAMDAQLGSDGSAGDIDAAATEDSGASSSDASTSDAPASEGDAGGTGSDASAPGDGGTQPDGCIAPRCPPIPDGCEVVGGTACTCGTIVCPAVACAPRCTRGEYCMYAMHCGGAGTCAPTPDACIDLFAPVCGCDGVTYSNSCDAAAAGQSVASDGECETAPADCRTAGCADSETCEECRGVGGPVYTCIPRGSAC